MPVAAVGSGGLRNQLNKRTAPIAMRANRNAEAALPTGVNSRPVGPKVVVSVVDESHEFPAGGSRSALNRCQSGSRSLAGAEGGSSGKSNPPRQKGWQRQMREVAIQTARGVE